MNNDTYYVIEDSEENDPLIHGETTDLLYAVQLAGDVARDIEAPARVVVARVNHVVETRVETDSYAV